MSLIGSMSAYIASRIINNVLDGNKYMFMMTSLLLKKEYNKQGVYCSRFGSNKNKDKENNRDSFTEYIKRLRELSNLPVAKCISKFVESTFSIDEDKEAKISNDLIQMIASKILLTTRRSSPIALIRNVKKLIIILFFYGLTYIILALSGVAAWILALGLLGLLIYNLKRTKSINEKDIKEEFVDDYKNKGEINKQIEKYIGNNNSNGCRAGQDLLSINCVMRNIHYCPSIADLTLSTVFPALVLSIFLEIHLILLFSIA